MRRRRLFLLMAALAATSAPARAEQIVPLSGCYERVYDAAWLKAHRGQIVQRVKLSVVKTAAPETPGDKQPILADAMLAVWPGPRAFTTIGACYWEREGLVCTAAFPAEEAPLCKTPEEGVRDCRLSKTDSGSFELAQKPQGLMVTVRERLELTRPQGGAYLYLGPGDPQNHNFLLQPLPEAACK